MKHTIKSNLTGKYLTNLFEDSHNKTFQADTFDKSKCYWYRNADTARAVAIELNGTVESINAG